MEKMPEQFPRLHALYGRGSATYTGAPLSFLLIEVRGGKLYITGEMPLHDDGDHYTAPGSAYQYVLDGYAAEQLFPHWPAVLKRFRRRLLRKNLNSHGQITP